MPSILVIRHVPHEDLGLLAEVFDRSGLEFSYLNTYETLPSEFRPARHAGLVVMGGPMNVDETDRYPHLAHEVTWLRQAVTAELPVLGICLGAQLLAKALGARVFPNRVKEIGWYDIELTDEASDDFLFRQRAPVQTVFQWHGDTFDLPAGAVHLARSPDCPQQAFRYGERAYGLQFHLELTPELLHTWLQKPEMCGELACLDYIDGEALRRYAPQRLPAVMEFGSAVFGRFAELCRQRAHA